MEFKDRLCKARKNKGLKQSELSRLVGVAVTTYSGWERGAREPNLFKMKLLIEVLEVDSSWLLGVKGFREFSPKEVAMVKKYRQLDPRGQATVDRTLDGELASNCECEADLLSEA